MSNQLSLAFTVDTHHLTLFLNDYMALEDEIDRLKNELLLCKDHYGHLLPMRATLVAVKVVRARKKLEQHPKEPLPLTNQAYLENLVQCHLDMHDAAIVSLTEEVREMLEEGATREVKNAG